MIIVRHPAETVKILRKKWKEYNPIDLGEKIGNFLLNNDLGINMDADYDPKPNGKMSRQIKR